MADSVSVVLPTRNRRQELLSTIQTVLSSSHEELILHVFDNASEDDTRDAVLAIEDPRIEYTRSDAVLPITASFEAAYKLARGDWITGLGSDDGFSRVAIAEMLALAMETGLQAVASEHASYHWPGVSSDHGRLSVRPMSDAEVLSSKRTVRKVLAGQAKYQELPTAYKSGIVHRSVLQSLRIRSNRLFNSWNPDVFLGFAVAQETDYFVMSRRPLTISGTSASSTGWSTLGGGTDPSAGAEYFALSRSGVIDLDERIAAVDGSLPKSMLIMTYEAYLKATPSPAGVRERVLAASLFQLGALLSDSRATSPEIIQWTRRLARAEGSGLLPRIRWIAARIHSLGRAYRASLRRLWSAKTASSHIRLTGDQVKAVRPRARGVSGITVSPGPATVAAAAEVLNLWLESDASSRRT